MSPFINNARSESFYDLNALLIASEVQVGFELFSFKFKDLIYCFKCSFL